MEIPVPVQQTMPVQQSKRRNPAVGCLPHRVASPGAPSLRVLCARVGFRAMSRLRFCFIAPRSSRISHHYHRRTKSIDLSPIVRNDNDRDLIGAVLRCYPSIKTALETAPNPFSALFDKLSRWFIKTLPASPLKQKTGRKPPPKSLIPKDRAMGG